MNQPYHGERTKNGIWLDETAFDEPLLDPRQGVNVPDCDDVECTYNFVENVNSPDPVELTYNAEYGLWLCPTHWAEVEAMAQPEIVKIDNGHYQVRMDGDIISNHSSRWGAEQVVAKMAQSTYEPPRLTTYGNTPELMGNR